MKPTSLALAIVLVALALLMSLDIQAQAAPAAPAAPTPISENCEQVATVGIIEYYFCESDYGDFFTNSFGFMLPPDY